MIMDDFHPLSPVASSSDMCVVNCVSCGVHCHQFAVIMADFHPPPPVASSSDMCVVNCFSCGVHCP